MLLQMLNVSSYYGSTPVLDGLSFSVESGEAVGLIGLEGAGKSTVLRLLTGFIAPNQGKVLVMGINPALPEARRHIGYLPQRNPLPKDMRVREYLLFRARLRGLSRRQARTSAATAAEFCGVADNYDSLIGRLSKISRRRVGLAEAALAKPPLLLLDEPTAGLEPEQAAEIRSLLVILSGVSTLFMASRVLHDVEELCRRALVFDRGRLLADGPARAICDNNVEERTLSVELAADAPVKEALRAIPGVKAIQVVPGGEPRTSIVRLSTPAGVDLRREVMELCARRGWLITEMRLEPVRLEDLFRRLSRTA